MQGEFRLKEQATLTRKLPIVAGGLLQASKVATNHNDHSAKEFEVTRGRTHSTKIPSIDWP